jgi:hypothetical protein
MPDGDGENVCVTPLGRGNDRLTLGLLASQKLGRDGDFQRPLRQRRAVAVIRRVKGSKGEVYYCSTTTSPTAVNHAGSEKQFEKGPFGV